MLRFILQGEWENPLTPWATAKVAKHIDKMATWAVHPVTNMIYEVKDGWKDGIVDIQQRTCSCRKFELSGLPCAHAAAVARYLRLSDCNLWASDFFTTETLRKVYMEAVFPVGDQSEWIPPEEPIVVLPPVITKRRAGRPRDNARIPSRGEEPIQQFCSRCNVAGHTRLNCRSPMPVPHPSGTRRNSRRNNTEPGPSCNTPKIIH